MEVVGYIKDLEFSELIRLYHSVDNNAKMYHDIETLDSREIEEDEKEFIKNEYERSRLVFMNQYFPENTEEDMERLISFCDREDNEDFKTFVEENKDTKINLIGVTLDATIEDDFELARHIILKNKLSDPIPHKKSWQTVFSKTLKPLMEYKPTKEFSDDNYFSRKQYLMFKVRHYDIFSHI